MAMHVIEEVNATSLSCKVLISMVEFMMQTIGDIGLQI